jgi:hypothetical protein
MITDCFDDAVILNMSIALERVCRDIPVELRKHEDRRFVADRILACAHSGQTRLDDLTAAGRGAVDELFPDAGQAA